MKEPSFNSTEDLDQLLSAMTDGPLSPAQEQRLADWLRQDAAARARYLDYMAVNTSLQWEYGAAAASRDTDCAGGPGASAGPEAPASWKRRLVPLSRPAVLAVSLAAVVILLLAILISGRWKVPSDPSLAAEAIATLASAENALWGNGVAPTAGQALPPGRLHLQSGRAAVRFERGATVTLSGPAQLELESRGSALLRSGRATVRAPEEARGFMLKTPSSDFVDLGTEFGVLVNPDASTEVHVFEGMVAARPRASEVAVTLYQDEAARIDAQWGEVVAVEFNPGEFPALAARPAQPAPEPKAAPAPAPLPDGARVIFLGDRATDRETHLLLVIQALAHLPPEQPPRLFNAGENFRLAFSEAAFAEQVLRFNPTHAVLEFGAQIALDPKGRSPLEFERDITRLLDRLAAADIEALIATAYPPGARFAEAEKKAAAFNAILRRLALERGLRVADYEAQFRRASSYGPPLVVENGIFPTHAGHREMAVALLRAMGFDKARLEGTLQTGLLPGVITQWKILQRPDEHPLEAAAVARLLPDEFWTSLELPQQDALSRRLPEQTWTITYRDRARGFATHLLRPESKSLVGAAILENAHPREVVFNTGALLRRIWLNGEKIFDNGGRWSGWHAGKERIPARLKAGSNTILIEAKDSFFLSITDRADWPLPPPPAAVSVAREF